MAPFVCLQAGGRVFALLFGPVYRGLGLHWELSEELCKLHPGFRWKNHSSRDPLMLPHAVIFLYTVSYVTMGFPTMHSLVQCQGKRTNNVLLWQPNMLPARLGSRTRFLLWSEFPPLKLSFPSHYSQSPLPFPTQTSAPLQSFQRVGAFIRQENLELQTTFGSSLINLFVLLNVFTQEITI